VWNLFIFANHSWNYLGTYQDYDKAQEAKEKIKENSERMVSVEQVNIIGSQAHMKKLYNIITNEELEK